LRPDVLVLAYLLCVAYILPLEVHVGLAGKPWMIIISISEGLRSHQGDAHVWFHH